MNKDLEKKNLRLVRNYLSLIGEALAYCEQNPVISAKRWFRYYGLYCLGKTLQVESTQVLGDVLKSKPVKQSLMYSNDLIDDIRAQINADLSKDKEISQEEQSKSM